MYVLYCPLNFPAGLAPPTHNADFHDNNPFVGFLPFLNSLPCSASHPSQGHLPYKLLILNSLSQGLLLRKRKLDLTVPMGTE